MPIMNSSRVRILIVAIAALTGAIPAATQVINPVVKSSWQSFLESLSGILWAALAIGTTLYLSKELKNLLWSVVQRLKSCSAVKIGPVEFGALNSIPAAIPEGQTAIFQRETSVSPHWKVEDLTEDDGTFRAQWDRYPAESKYAMLVHSYFPSSEPGQVYDVLVYFVERKTGALQKVSKVEYYFGPNWRNLIYTCENKAQSFAIRVSAYDRFVCIAKLHFTTKDTAIVARYIDFEMGVLPTIPTTPPEPGRAPVARS